MVWAVLTGRSTGSGFDLAWFSSSIFRVALYFQFSCCCVYVYFFVTFWTLFFASWAWWDCPLTWLTNHRPSVLWHCWLDLVIWPIKSCPKWPIMCREDFKPHYTILYRCCTVIAGTESLWTIGGWNCGRCYVSLPNMKVSTRWRASRLSPKTSTLASTWLLEWFRLSVVFYCYQCCSKHPAASPMLPALPSSYCPAV